ncbi:NAD(P)/FAD-dependent oxidoreductase [Frankia sp. CNm7]|uniref:Ferredoxin--NADP reductase n=1 Tax=Frankia nepalensis TaxID=1836974 RepID=A0A937USW8_9ACTN|nr:NAD(P)/FAD-dependent oxidoreductase [Frankia nepalensis]MBL7496056.1 NAD(P)/FAD-dependent oxidoreductase [Frankia nepalensis]MBL7511823.1 NAD(P)/FAD-dependent oxidoreductase [Frankia nepalensis]MBL7517232.1 NAD(P)/FAD-dependent oxidoreductase [Frankia nepalensis]MBL7630660.1 NAD(P)/FAD-dependent oxidoreductase [Frankia nepalensis]
MGDTSIDHSVDMLIVGAGPAGLFGAYYAGFRGMSVALMDSLPEPGGQVTAMYPEKVIYDIAGFPAVRGRDLVNALVEQVAPFNPAYLLGHQAAEITHEPDAILVTSAQGLRVRAKVIVITGGLGTFTPRPLPTGTEHLGRGLVYFVPRLDDYRDLDIVVVGGGDSAFDWALALEPLAKSVTVVHRRDKFRAHQHTVDRVLASSCEVLTFTEVAAISGDERIEKVELVHSKSGERQVRPAQAVVAALGFTADLGPLTRWGLNIDKRHIVVDTTMFTGVERIFAAGDITEYPGKVRLIATGFGEVATAVNNAAPVVDPSAKVFPGHSSDDGTPAA